MQIQTKHYWWMAFGLLAVSIAGGLTGLTAYLMSGHGTFTGLFYIIRPIHVSAAIGWILTAAMAMLYRFYIKQPLQWVKNLQFLLWMVSFLGIFISYFRADFYGREYWEYPPYWSLPLGVSWLLMLVQVLRQGMTEKPWKAWHWMWFTGALFFLYIFMEGYLWLLPSIRGKLVSDIALQWKVNGSLVGAWNQLIYGFSVYAASASPKSGAKFINSAKAIYLLGFLNMCLNWSHHFYILPIPTWIKATGYIISMTEWILLIKMIRDVYSVSDSAIFNRTFTFAAPYIKNAGFWIFLNLIVALFISVPGINKYSHGTHITVAHAMGTTIGINTMILMGAAAQTFKFRDPRRKTGFLLFNIGLGLLFFALIGAGISKSLWQYQSYGKSFSQMMLGLKIWWIPTMIGGLLCGGIMIRWMLLMIYSDMIQRTKSEKNS